MKMLDDVKVIKDRDEYKKENIFAGMIGTIIDAEIRFGEFFVCFQDQRTLDREFMSKEENIFKLKNDICIPIKIEDLELVKDGKCTDEMIKNSLPRKYPDWYCKVENGYIINLEGKKKNKIPYDYDS